MHHTVQMSSPHALPQHHAANHAAPAHPPSAMLRLLQRQGLCFLHSHGVLHLDVKPDNIYRSGGAWRIGDFGLAVARDKEGSMVRPGAWELLGIAQAGWGKGPQARLADQLPVWTAVPILALPACLASPFVCRTGRRVMGTMSLQSCCRRGGSPLPPLTSSAWAPPCLSAPPVSWLAGGLSAWLAEEQGLAWWQCLIRWPCTAVTRSLPRLKQHRCSAPSL